MTPIPATLAAIVSGAVWYWAVAALTLAAVIGGFVMLRVRRWVKEGSSATESNELEQLEQLRNSGSITPSEFSRAQNLIVKRLSGSSNSPRTNDRASDSAPKRR